VESKKGTVVDPCRLRINYGNCVSCAACPSVCHTLALDMDALTLELNEELCDNCSLCIRVCPTGALHFRDDKSTGAS
jgi:ferredoxin